MVTAFGNIYSVPNYVLDHSESDAGRQDRISTKKQRTPFIPWQSGIWSRDQVFNFAGTFSQGSGEFCGLCSCSIPSPKPSVFKARINCSVS